MHATLRYSFEMRPPVSFQGIRRLVFTSPLLTMRTSVIATIRNTQPSPARSPAEDSAQETILATSSVASRVAIVCSPSQVCNFPAAT
jgi:hypothetical protein